MDANPGSLAGTHGLIEALTPKRYNVNVPLEGMSAGFRSAQRPRRTTRGLRSSRDGQALRGTVRQDIDRIIHDIRDDEPVVRVVKVGHQKDRYRAP